MANSSTLYTYENDGAQQVAIEAYGYVALIAAEEEVPQVIDVKPSIKFDTDVWNIVESTEKYPYYLHEVVELLHSIEMGIIRPERVHSYLNDEQRDGITEVYHFILSQQ